MVKQLVIPFVLVGSFIILVGLLVKNSSRISIPGITPAVSSESQNTVKIGGKTLEVDIADTPEKREKGLSGKTDLSGDRGMLFIFESADKNRGFWMKGMLIPLDLIWIKGGLVVKIDENVEPPKAGTPDASLPIYMPGQAVDQVLEVRGGYSNANGISVGSKVEIPGI